MSHVGRRGPLLGLLTAQGISVGSSRVTMIALPWLVLVSTGSAAKTGVVASAETLPYVLASALGGPFINRMGPRRVGISADLTSAFVLGAVVVASKTGQLSLWLLLILVALFGLLRSGGDNAKRVLLPDVVATSGVALERATSFNESIGRMAMLLGAPLAGLLITLVGAVNVLLVNVVMLPLGAASLALATAGLSARPDRASSARTYLASLRAGAGYVWHDTLIRGIVLVLVLTNLFDQAFFSVLLPVWVRAAGGTAAELGLLAGALGLGALIGSLTFAALAPKAPRYLTFALALVLGGAPRLFVMAATDAIWPMIGVAFATGLAISVLNPILYAVAYQRIPRAMQANVLGMAVAAAWAGIPLGGLIGGWALQWLGLRPGLLVLAGIYLAATLLPTVLPVWRQLDRPRVQPDPAPEPVPADSL